MSNILNKSLWISLYLLFPITLIGLFAQNAIPGDFLYPLKLNMENVGLLVFSLTPESKASFNSTLTDRRFDEAQKLIAANSSTSGLETLVAQAVKTQESVHSVNDPKQKEVLKEKLIQDINDYQEKLTQTQQKVDPTYIPPTPTPTPIATPTPKPSIRSFVAPTKVLVNPYITRKPTQIPTFTPSPTQAVDLSPSPTPTIKPPTPQQPLEIVKNIEKTKEELEKIKEHIQSEPLILEQSAAVNPTEKPIDPTDNPTATLTPTSPSTTFTPTPILYPKNHKDSSTTTTTYLQQKKKEEDEKKKDQAEN